MLIFDMCLHCIASCGDELERILRARPHTVTLVLPPDCCSSARRSSPSATHDLFTSPSGFALPIMIVTALFTGVGLGPIVGKGEGALT